MKKVSQEKAVMSEVSKPRWLWCLAKINLLLCLCLQFCFVNYAHADSISDLAAVARARAARRVDLQQTVSQFNQNQSEMRREIFRNERSRLIASSSIVETSTGRGVSTSIQNEELQPLVGTQVYDPIIGKNLTVTAHNIHQATAFGSPDNRDLMSDFYKAKAAQARLDQMAIEDDKSLASSSLRKERAATKEGEARFYEELAQSPEKAIKDRVVNFDAYNKRKELHERLARLEAASSDIETEEERKEREKELQSLRDELAGRTDAFSPTGNSGQFSVLDPATPVGNQGPAGDAGPPQFDTTEINSAICDIFDLMEGGLGALMSVAAGVGALFAMAFGAYKAGYGLIVVAAAGFVVRSFVSIFFGTFNCAPV